MKKPGSLSAGITIVLFGIIAVCCDLLYCLNDDVMIQSVLSGAFSGQPSGMCVYLSQPLSSILSFLYLIIPMIPWYGLLLTGCYCICFFLILWRVLKHCETKKEMLFMIGICLIAFIALFFRSYVMIHYTVVAAACGGSGLFLWMTKNPETKKKTDFLYPMVLFFLCYQIRSKVFLMLCPFLLLAGLVQFLTAPSKKKFCNLWIQIGCVLLGILVLFGINKLCYSGEMWQQYSDYNDARTEVYDYVGVWQDETSIQYYKSQGLTDREQDIYLSYDLMLLSQNGTEEGTRQLQLIAGNPYAAGMKDTLITRVKNALWIYRDRTFGGTQDSPYNYLALGFYLLLAILVIGIRKYRHLLTIVLSFMARSVLFLYLFLNGRYPERVIVSIYLIEFLFLSASVICILSKEDKKKRLCRVLWIAVGMLLLYGTFVSIRTTMTEGKEQKTVNQEEDVVYSYMDSHQENLYFLDVYATVNHTQTVFTVDNDSMQNYLILGGWMSGHPLVNRKMNYYGYSDITEALSKGTNLYLVIRENVGVTEMEICDWLSTYHKTIVLYDTLDGGKQNYLIYQIQDQGV